MYTTEKLLLFFHLTLPLRWNSSGNSNAAEVPLYIRIGGRRLVRSGSAAVARIKLSFEAQNAFSISIRGVVGAGESGCRSLSRKLVGTWRTETRSQEPRAPPVSRAREGAPAK